MSRPELHKSYAKFQAFLDTQAQKLRDATEKELLKMMAQQFLYTVNGEPAIDTLPERTHVHAELAATPRTTTGGEPNANAQHVEWRPVRYNAQRPPAGARFIGVDIESDAQLWESPDGSVAYVGAIASDQRAVIDELPRGFRDAGPCIPATCAGYVGRPDPGAANPVVDAARDAIAYGVGLLRPSANIVGNYQP
jgi:hypothetical protein